MFGLSLAHILIILLVVLLFGAKRIPELGESLGKGLRKFKEGLDGKLDDKTATKSDAQQTKLPPDNKDPKDSSGDSN